MSDNELKLYFYNCLNGIISGADISYNFDVLTKIKYFMYNNSSSQDVIDMKRYLCECIYSLYDNSSLKEALTISDNFMYGKKLRLYGLTHSDKYKNFESFFISVVYVSYGIKRKDYYNWFLSDNGFNTIIVLDKLNEYGALNMRLTKSNYNSLDQELFHLRKALKGDFNFSDYNDFIKNEVLINGCYNRQYIGNYENDYINKKIGNIGELSWYNYLKEMDDRTILASRDYGDGLGYDIYGIQNDNGTSKELLIEVKSTMNPDKNGFQLSENEYAVMKDVLSNSNVNYLVATAFIDSSSNFKIIRNGFVAKEDKFYSIVDGEEYLLEQSDSGKVFKKKLV